MMTHLMPRPPVAHRLLRLAWLGLLAIVCCITAMSSRPAEAQTTVPPAALLADSVTFDGAELVASGNVEVLYDDTRLTASRITYARDTGALTIEGPLRLSQSGGDAVLLADSAELDSQLREGILSSARLVLARKYQLAAARITREEGRYTRLSKAVTSACEVCADNPVPLWEIRADEVVHDSVERQIYFQGAQFRLGGVPLLYLPRLRIPDPTLERSTGFLPPEFVSSSTLGFGVELPYFITLGESRDLTLSPLITTDSATLKYRYRQETARGSITTSGAITSDTLDSSLRGYAFFDGEWDLGNDLTFAAHLKATSDIAYLVDYDIYGRDRLPSELSLTRYSTGEALDVRLIGIRTLREAEVAISDTLPFLFGELHYDRDIDSSSIPGQLSFGLSASGHLRKSDADVDGMDVFRLGAELDWSHGTVLGGGFTLDAAAHSAIDLYAIRQNSNYDSTVARTSQAAAVRLSYPMVRTTSARDGGTATELLEPFVQLGWAGSSGGNVPNSDSRLVEFDEGNLLSLSRFPGADRTGSGGASATLGLRYTRSTNSGSYGITMGRVLYETAATDYTEASGLSGKRSDWLVGGYLEFDTGVELHTRGLFDSNLSVTKWETRLDLLRPTYSLAATHAYVIEDTDEDRDDPINEIALSGSVDLSPNWTASAAFRHDMASEVTNEASLGVTYQNECMRIGFEISRRFSDTSALDPSTEYALSVGFGAYDTDTDAGRCSYGGL